MNLKNDPRYNYAFINCTNCGPRYSIIEDLPYDRPKTSMKKFEMCDPCFEEYDDPFNRRFHAQPIACPRCGPKLSLLDKNFIQVKGDPVENAKKFLLQGKIVGIKGIGGFHIACDATNKKAVESLRKRKNRPHKPFAVMVHLDNVKKIVQYNSSQLELLKSPAAPIVILKKIKQSILADNIAPDNPCLGVFLPYAPIHYLILDDKLPFLIMTSGNIQDEPIANEERDLNGLCDYYLTNNRPIENRSDDSVIMPLDKESTGKGSLLQRNIIMRRSRGYVPLPFKLPFETVPTLGCGAELKLCFSLSREKLLFTSPYIGNADNKKTIDHFIETVETYKRWFRIKPELAACDLHPDYFTSRFANELGLPVVKVQHHFAHIVSVMAEHNINEPVIGVAYDGTGYGEDGHIWGSEIMITEYRKFERMFHLNYMPLPGGDAAIKHPARISFAYLEEAEEDTAIIKNLSQKEKKIISKQVKNGFNIFYTSGMGRLFDCVSGMLNLVDRITYEAQAPILLEHLAGDSISTTGSYSYLIQKDVINIRPMLKDIVRDIKRKRNPKLISGKFHNTVVKFTLDSIKKTNKLTNIKKVVLSGGVMQNRIILNGLLHGLEKNGFQTFLPGVLPVNDGSISSGQVVAANVFSNTG